jgi:hypothetical protein
VECFVFALSHLASFDCPVVIGDIPDGVKSVGRILAEDEYPGREAIDLANGRIAEWLKKNPKVIQISLADFPAKATADEEVTIAGETTGAGVSRARFLQWDLLHPSEQGAATLVLSSLEALQKKTGFDKKEVEWSKAKLLPPAPTK